ncbi:TIGR03985 family CRISPR-associated protein [Anabaena catenula]|uniref:TIGR03985 family CRISPR-associated protein n=1 Tax=Anabaena catenula FACHB-362 TaxID=2692877 RepID=A0ABR8J188_9NOST|nr:TIGR03985 family CRISPR-associated protein [Anabaena catenula FACHB-362]
MSEQIFSDVPQVELLQWLARGSLKQNLLRAVRLWVWLCSLYGEGQDQIFLEDGFTLADWKNAFFSSTHPKGEAIPQFHDPNCNCAKTTADWLFDAKTGLNPEDWKHCLLSHVHISNLDEILDKRLFGVTRRSLQADLQILEELGWLEIREQKYHRVKYLPSRPITIKHNYNELHFLNQEDLAEIAQNLSQKIGGVQRFFFKLDYVVTAIDQVENWQDELRKLWSQTPVPPISLIYNSARLKDSVECLVYPVCIYYVQRAVYLCAFGESPDKKTDWYNFRLDRIENITPIEWTNPGIPKTLQQRYHQRNLPNSEEIELQMDKALGFDFYLESRLMLLRFERDYHDRYIQDTSRHNTFKLIGYQKAKSLIQSSVINSEQKAELLKVMENRSPKDAYYSLQYRHGDNNVIMRLRAWRPKVEILLPYDLRQRIAADITKEIGFYHI